MPMNRMAPDEVSLMTSKYFWGLDTQSYFFCFIRMPNVVLSSFGGKVYPKIVAVLSLPV